MVLTPKSVHIPQAMKDISIRGWRQKKRKYPSVEDTEKYAKLKQISFVEAFKELLKKVTDV